MSVLTVVPEFLYPKSRQFPFDEVAEKIVKELEKRNFDVPNLKVEFGIYGSGETKYKYLRKIISDDFILIFSRSQGQLNSRWSNCAALSNVIIPKKEIHVFSDESGPLYHIYVGKDWEKDKDWFMNCYKVHAKLNNEERKYLKYTGNRYCTRSEVLIADDDLQREYSPEEGEPTSFKTDEVFLEFIKYLEDNVLNYILKFPEKPLQIDEIKLIEYNGKWPYLFSIGDARDVEKIEKGKENIESLNKEDRFVSLTSMPRLVHLNIPCNNKFPKIAYEGFIWCDVNQAIDKDCKTEDISSTIKHEMFTFNYRYVICIKLKYANDVYVIENSKFDEKRNELFEKIAPRERLTNIELAEAIIARGATIVPITEYEDNYVEPIVLINRELDFDEIEWVKKIE